MIVQKVAPEQTEINDILSLNEAKSFLKVIGNEEDTDIQSFIDSAIAEAQDITNLQFAFATYELYLENFPRENFKFPKNPVQEIISIEYMDLEGNYQTLDSSIFYLNKVYGVGQIVFISLPNVKVKNHKQAIKITFKSGFIKSSFPSDLRQWLKVRVSTFYEYREELTVAVSVSKNKHIDSILQRHKVVL